MADLNGVLGPKKITGRSEKMHQGAVGLQVCLLWFSIRLTSTRACFRSLVFSKNGGAKWNRCVSVVLLLTSS